MIDKDEIGDISPEALTCDGFDEAIIGIAERIGMETIVAYDKDKVLEILMKDMSYEEAMEYYEYNILGALMGDFTPIFIEKIV